jgi:glyoxylase-like metal-dependent hydrolase (beta-lactamase superfamily II)
MSTTPYDLPVADLWWEITRVDQDVTLLREPHVDPLLRCNVWHVRGRDRDMVVDSGVGVVSLTAAAQHLFEHAVIAVASHSHYDHTGGFWEFADRAMHPAEADVTRQTMAAPLVKTELGWPDDMLGDYDVADVLVTAAPQPGWDPVAHSQPAAPPTQLVDEGDVIDLGDRAFEVLHLPGHSPGSIGLWEAASGTLFSGDAIYDGPLLDQLPGSDIGRYCETMRRLRELPVDVVHGGHDEDFGRERLVEICDTYLKRAGA